MDRHGLCSSRGVGVDRFEDLRVWQAAMALSDKIPCLTNRPGFAQDLELARQLNSASLSVASNISEGFLRHRDREFLQFLRIAAGSNGEVRSCLHAARGRGYLDRAEAEKLVEETNIIGRMLRSLQQTLEIRSELPADGRQLTRNQGRTKDQEPTQPRTKDEPGTKA